MFPSEWSLNASLIIFSLDGFEGVFLLISDKSDGTVKIVSSFSLFCGFFFL